MSINKPLDRLAFAVEECVSRLGNLGVLVGIALPNGERHYAASGHANPLKSELINKYHLFQIGSQSKTFVAIAILLLARDGKLHLDDPVVKHIQLQIDPRITIKQLIMNTSGLGEYTFAMGKNVNDPYLKITPRELIDFALPLGQLFSPGERFDYCNTGWVVATLVIEAAAGMRYQDFINEAILQPLELADSYVGMSYRLPREQVASTALITAAGAEPIEIGRDTTLEWAAGAGDIIGNCDDLLNFYSALMRPGNKLGITLNDLSSESRIQTGRPHFSLSHGVEYGYGVERRSWAGRPVWGHPGRTPGYSTGTWADPEQGVVITTCFTAVADATEALEIPTFLRFAGAQIFTLALDTAYSMLD